MLVIKVSIIIHRVKRDEAMAPLQVFSRLRALAPRIEECIIAQRNQSMRSGPEKLPVWKLVIFALGQLGWSLASYGVSNLIMYFYMPPETAAATRIFPPFLYEGAVLGVFTIIGLINFGARFFDAVSNPLLASWSDRSRSRLGRRRFFLAVSAVPFALLGLLFGMFSLMGLVKVPPLVFAYATVAVAAIPIAIFTIVPNAIVADIAEADGIETGNFKAGMFFGVRSFESNLGVSAANILFPSLLVLGMSVDHPIGIRMSAVLRSLAKKEKLSPEELKEAADGANRT